MNRALRIPWRCAKGDRERGYPFDSQIQQLEKVPGGMAHQPVSAIKFNAFLLIAYPAKQSFCITLAFAQTTQREHTTTVQKPEIATLAKYQYGSSAEVYHKKQRELTTQPAFLATGTPFGINVIISFFPIFQHLVYQFRRSCKSASITTQQSPVRNQNPPAWLPLYQSYAKG